MQLAKRESITGEFHLLKINYKCIGDQWCNGLAPAEFVLHPLSIPRYRPTVIKLEKVSTDYKCGDITSLVVFSTFCG